MPSVLLQLLGGTKPSHALRRWVNLWPPLLGAGIRVQRIATDPFYMLMVMANLGSDYIVWDKAASIRYRKPGKGTVRAEFRLSDSQLDDIREKLKTLPKYEPVFTIEVKDETGVVIAEVEKRLHVRKKDSAPEQPRSGERVQPTA
jgi:hypothetical protein